MNGRLFLYSVIAGGFLILISFVTTRLYLIMNPSKQIEMISLNASERARLVLENDIAQTGYDPRYMDLQRSKIPLLKIAQHQQLQVIGDFNMSGVIGDHALDEMPEQIVYSFNSVRGQLYRGQTLLLDSLKDFSFQYINFKGQKENRVPGLVIQNVNSIQWIEVHWTWAQDLSSPQNVKFQVKLQNAQDESMNG